MAIEYTEVMIPVSELQLGMHVVRLDRPWTETNFLVQGFIIENHDEIDSLISQCEFVYIQGKSLSQDEHTQHPIPRPRKQKKGFFSRKEPAPNTINRKHQVIMSRPPQGKMNIPQSIL